MVVYISTVSQQQQKYRNSVKYNINTEEKKKQSSKYHNAIITACGLQLPNLSFQNFQVADTMR